MQKNRVITSLRYLSFRAWYNRVVVKVMWDTWQLEVIFWGGVSVVFHRTPHYSCLLALSLFWFSRFLKYFVLDAVKACTTMHARSCLNCSFFFYTIISTFPGAFGCLLHMEVVTFYWYYAVQGSVIYRFIDVLAICCLFVL